MRPIGLSAAAASRPVASRVVSNPPNHCHQPVAFLAAPARARRSSSHDATPSKSFWPPARQIAKLLERTAESEMDNVAVQGFVRSVRSMKTATFVSVGDGSSLAPMQAIIPADQASGISVGAAVRLFGSWAPSPGKGQSHELRVSKVDVVGPSDAQTFPIQKKYQTPEYLRTVPHLRPRTPFNSALLRLRSDVIHSVSQFFASHDFVQTHPPTITSSDCEGAGEVFTISPASDGDRGDASSTRTRTNPKDDEAHHFFRSPKYLTVSSQLHLEALAQAVGNVWTLSPTFRAEQSDTSRHLSEFYMLEAEMAFADDMEGVMRLLEDMLSAVATRLYATPVVRELQQRPSREGAADLAAPEEVDARWRGLMAGGWPRITYTEAVALLGREAGGFALKPPQWGAGLQAEHEKHIARVVGGGKPVFVTHYPRDIKAFYMRQSSSPPSGRDGGGLYRVVPPPWVEKGDPATAAADAAASTRWDGATAAARVTVDCFDLLVPELCEIAGGSMREHRLGPLLGAMQLHGLVAPPGVGVGVGVGVGTRGTSPEEVGQAPAAGALDWYVDLRRWGCPPHGGFGIGFDRLLCYLSGVPSIRDVVTFPRWHGRCDC